MIIYNNKNNPFYGVCDLEQRINQTSRYESGFDTFENQYGIIIRSSAFRRLQAKTQVIGPGVGDFHRTRLTHSLEVAQLARKITIHLNGKNSEFKENKIDCSLIEAASLAHDIGHPPFGHQGEMALNKCMRKFGGFEGNAHTFRILSKLEGDGKYGLNPTRALLLSIMKYPVILSSSTNKDILPPKAGAFESDREVFDWVIGRFSDLDINYFLSTKDNKTINKTIECSIVELADDLAYCTHDIEDAIHLGMIKIEDLYSVIRDFPEIVSLLAGNNIKLEGTINKYKLKQFFHIIITVLIANIGIVVNSNADSCRLRTKVIMPADCLQLVTKFKKLVDIKVIKSQRVQMARFKSDKIISSLFDSIFNDLSLLPENDRIKLGSTSNDLQIARIVCDYIAGMTDSFATKVYKELFGIIF